MDYGRNSHSVQCQITKDWRFLKSFYVLQKCSISGADGLDVGKGWWKQVIIQNFIFFDRASRYKFLLITNLTHFFLYLFISSLYMFRASQCSSSGDRIVLIYLLVWHRLIIPDDVLIQFDLLMMSTAVLETCREIK